MGSGLPIRIFPLSTLVTVLPDITRRSQDQRGQRQCDGLNADMKITQCGASATACSIRPTFPITPTHLSSRSCRRRRLSSSCVGSRKSIGCVACLYARPGGRFSRVVSRGFTYNLRPLLFRSGVRVRFRPLEFGRWHIDDRILLAFTFVQTPVCEEFSSLSACTRYEITFWCDFCHTPHLVHVQYTQTKRHVRIANNINQARRLSQ